MKIVKRFSDRIDAFDNLPFAQKLGWRLLAGSVILTTIGLTAWNVSGLGPAEEARLRFIAIWRQEGHRLAQPDSSFPSQCQATKTVLKNWYLS